MHKLQRILQPLSPLFLPQLAPVPDTYMFEEGMKEAPQSFLDYVMERPPAPARSHYKIYLLPLTEPSETSLTNQVGTLPDLRILQRFIEFFFDLPCKILPYDPLLSKKGIASRSNGRGNDLQYHAKDSLRQLRIRLPMDGFCILGITMADLFESSGKKEVSLFVHSSLSLKDRAGIVSFCRLDPAWYRVSCRREGDFATSVAWLYVWRERQSEEGDDVYIGQTQKTRRLYILFSRSQDESGQGIGGTCCAANAHRREAQTTKADPKSHHFAGNTDQSRPSGKPC